MRTESEEIIIQGTPGSPGISFAPVHVMARGFSAPEVYQINPDQVTSEQNRFKEALETTKVQLDKLRRHIENLSGEEEGKIFDAHLMVLEDQTLLTRVNTAISDRKQNAEFAFYAVIVCVLCSDAKILGGDETYQRLLPP